MSDAGDTNSTAAVQNCLDRLKNDESGASSDLLAQAMRRLRRLAKKILADIPAVQRWDSTDDLLQSASLRLWNALEENRPATPVDFFRLAACVIRRELIDLSRSRFGPQGWGANHATPRNSNHASGNGFADRAAAADASHNPEKLSEWTEFHEYVENLPDDERRLFDLLWYQGLTLAEASDLLEIPLRSLGRYWKLARVNLANSLLGQECTDRGSES